jgi:hypothetical protein
VPAFGQNGKKDITIYQLLCHKAGIPTINVKGVDAAELLLDTKEVLRLLYASAPERPGPISRLLPSIVKRRTHFFAPRRDTTSRNPPPSSYFPGPAVATLRGESS